MFHVKHRFKDMGTLKAPRKPAHLANQRPLPWRDRLHGQTRILDQHHLRKPWLGLDRGHGNRLGQGLFGNHIDRHPRTALGARVGIGRADDARDLDGDADVDLVLASHLRGFTALRNDGGGTFTDMSRGLPFAPPGTSTLCCTPA